MRYFLTGVFCFSVCCPQLLIAQSPVHHFEGHTSAVYSVNFSPSGRLVVSTGFDETVRVWDAATRAPITTFRGHSGIVLNAMLSPDESMIASSGLDRTIRLWNVPQSKPVHSESPFAAKLTAAAYVPTGGRIVVSDERSKLFLWDVEQNKLLGEVDGPTEKPVRILIRPDGNAFATVDESGLITAYTANPLAKQTEWRAHLGDVIGAAYTPNNSYLITVGADGLLRRWTASPKASKEFETTAAKIGTAQLAATGNLLATADADDQIRLWDVNQGKSIRSISQQANHLSLSSNQQKLVAVGNDKIVRLYQTGDGKLLGEFPVLPDNVSSLSIRSDERQIAVGLSSGTILVLDSKEGTTAQSLAASAGANVVWDSDNKHLYSATQQGHLKRWNIESGTETASFDCETPISSLAFDPRKKQLAVGLDNGIIRILSAEKLETQSEWQAHATAVTQLDFSTDSSQLISGISKGPTTLWDIDQKLPMQHFGGDRTEFVSVAIHPDKSVILVERDGQIVRLPQAGQLAVRLTDEKPLSIAVSRNSNECAVAFDSERIRTYTISNGQEAKLYDQTGHVSVLNYSPNNSYLASGDPAGIVTLWRLSNQRREGLILTPRPIVSLEFSHDSNKLLVTGDDRKIRLYTPGDTREPDSLEVRRKELASPFQELQLGEHPILGLAISSDHSTAWTQNAIGKLETWQLSSPQAVASLTGHRGQVYGIAFHPKDPKLVSVSSDKTVRLWDLTTRKSIRTLVTLKDVLYSVQFSPDGKSIYVAGADRTVRELDAETGRELRVFEGSKEVLYSVAVSPDGRQIAAAGTGLGPEREILVWNRDATVPALRLMMKTDSVYRVQFDAAGETLFVVGYNGRVEFFSLAEKKSRYEQLVPSVVYSGTLSPDGTSFILATSEERLLHYVIEK